MKNCIYPFLFCLWSLNECLEMDCICYCELIINFRHYFAIATNSGEQFYMFTSMAAWLLRTAGRNFEQPQEVNVLTTINSSCLFMFFSSSSTVFYIVFNIVIFIITTTTTCIVFKFLISPKINQMLTPIVSQSTG